MPNPIKYTTGTESQALKKGNFYIGTGDVGKGPSDTTGFYQGISPSSGGYVIYMNKSGAPGDLSYHNAPTDAELISFTNSLAGQSYTTVNECLVYFAGQTDKVCVNRDYEGIVTDGLVLNLDAGFTPSYPKNGTTWYDVGGANNGTLTNGPTFSSNDGGSIVFDGVNDYAQCSKIITTIPFTVGMWMSVSIINRGESHLLTQDLGGDLGRLLLRIKDIDSRVKFFIGGVEISSNTSVIINTWYYTVFTRDVDGTGKIYVNGVLEAIGTFNTNNIADTNTVLGYFPRVPSYSFPGKISNTQIYNRALTSSEVLQNYNAQKGRFGL
jgi:hypothetical protein